MTTSRATTLDQSRLHADRSTAADLETTSTYHTPVLLAETIEQLGLHPGSIILDGTLGGGGHARAILARTGPTGQVVGFDQDLSAIRHVQATLAHDYPNRLIVIHANVSQLSEYLPTTPALSQLTGALLDLGISAHQLVEPGRGFSFHQPNDPLDMRMDQTATTTAADLVNTASLGRLITILQQYGEEPRAKTVAQAIIAQRTVAPLRTVGDLLTALATVYREPQRRIFQALRIAVNEELERLPGILTTIMKQLAVGSRFAVITFHSLEDRIVKQTFAAAAKGCICPPVIPVCVCGHEPSIKLITKKPIVPTHSEIKTNPKARSAKLRVIEIIKPS